MENGRGPNLTAILGIIGGVIGIPLSYFFQPGLIRAKLSLGDYLKAFPNIIAKLDKTPSEILFPAILTPIILAAIGAAIGYFVKQNQSKAQIKAGGDSFVPEKESSSYSREIDNETRAVMEGYQLKIRNDLSNVDLMCEYADFLNKHDLNDEAVFILLKAATIDNTNGRIKSSLYKLYLKTGSKEKAISIGNEIHNDHLKDENFLISFLNLLIENGDMERALSLSNDILELNPKNIAVLLKRAQLLKSKKSGDLIDCLKAILLIDPNNYYARYNRAVLECLNGDFQASIIQLKELLPIANDDPKKSNQVKAYIALSLHKLGGHDEKANKFLNTIPTQDILTIEMEHVGDNYDLLEFSGKYKKSEGEYDDAQKLFEAASSIKSGGNISSQIADCYYLRSLDYFEKGNINGSASELNRALQFDDENPGYLDLKTKIKSYKKSKSLRIKIVATSIATIAICAFGTWYASHGKIQIITNETAKEIIVQKDNKIIEKILNNKSLSNDFIKAGDYDLVVVTDGYEKYTEGFTIGWLSNKKINVAQKPMYGGLKIDSLPSGMEVLVDNQSIGKTPIRKDNILAKRTKLVLQDNGYYWEKYVDIEKAVITDLGKVRCNFSLDNLATQKIIDPSLENSDYCADFNTQNGGWENLSNKNYTISIQKGKLVFSTHSGDRFAWRGKSITGDSWYSADLQKTSQGYRNAFYGIVIRADYVPTSNKNYKFIWTFFGISDSGKYKIIEYRAGNGGHTLKQGNLNTNISGRQNNMAIQCIGDEYTFYLNGNKVTTVYNTRHGGSFKGNVGVGIDTGRVTVEYDNIFAKELPYFYNLKNERVVEDFNGDKSSLQKKYVSKYLSIKEGKAQFSYWKGWVWESYFNAPDDNYSIKLNCRAQGKNAKWGPIVLYTSEAKLDGNRKYSNNYCIGIKINKHKKWTIFYYDSTAGSYSRLKELYNGSCSAIQPNATNEFRIDKKINKLSFFINDNYVATLNLQSKYMKKKLHSGNFGFFIDNGSALFDDIRIFDLE